MILALVVKVHRTRAVYSRQFLWDIGILNVLFNKETFTKIFPSHDYTLTLRPENVMKKYCIAC